MTEHGDTHATELHPELVVVLRRIADQAAQAERMLIGVTSQLEEVAKQPVPPNPPGPPPWREILTRLEVVIESCVATSLRARRDVQVVIQGLPEGNTRG